MKFAVILEGQVTYPTRENEQEVLRQNVELGVLAEEAGFDRVWAVEHHALKWFAHISAPETVLAWVAARTSRIRVGHAVVCAPFKYNHPVRVAERVATLDILSSGRVDVGFGRGSTEQELGIFGVDADETLAQMVEALKVIPQCWTQDEVEYHSDLLDIPRRPIIPKPVQDPHPPLYIACSRDETVGLAGRLGVGALALGFAGAEEMAAKRKIYDDAIAGRDDGTVVGAFPVEHLAGLSLAVCLDDRERARRLGLRGQRFFTESIQHWYTGGPVPNPEIDEFEDHTAALANRAEQVTTYLQEHGHQMPGYDMARGSSVADKRIGSEAGGGFNPDQCYGDVDDCISYVERMADAGVDELMFTFQMGTVPFEVCRESLLNVGRRVIPHFT
ncbi:MAG TPA: LLM class flavin-dependent oxidoreductase [Acidimicrobiales bacterium]|nr:LLM class flavin-dependent oxidoreductase [Acidimicrobiales bacterium]